MRSIEMTRHHKSNNVYNILKQIIKSEFLKCRRQSIIFHDDGVNCRSVVSGLKKIGWRSRSSIFFFFFRLSATYLQLSRILMLKSKGRAIPIYPSIKRWTKPCNFCQYKLIFDRYPSLVTFTYGNYIAFLESPFCAEHSLKMY